MTGSIPNHCNPAPRVLSLQALQESKGRLGIPFLVVLEAKRLSCQVQGSIIGLPLAFIGHGYLNPFARLAPNIPTQVSPQQMALVLEENH